MSALRVTSALAALLLLSSCTASRSATQPGAENLNPAQVALRAFVDAHFEEQFRRNPTMATRAGIHTYDAELRGFTAQERMENLAHIKEQLAALPQKVDRARHACGSAAGNNDGQGVRSVHGQRPR